MREVDVIIVGLGPTGATLAGLLGRAGMSVAVFDRLPDLYPLPRAIGLDHEALRIFQEMGLTDALQESIAPYRMTEYRGVDGAPIKRLDTLPEPYPLGWAPNYVFDQPGLERTLRAALATIPKVSVHLSTEVVATGQEDGHVWADAQAAGQDAPQRFTARYLVACDGGASPVRKRLGIALEDLDFDEPWLVVDAIVSDDKLKDLPQTQVQYCEPERPSTFVIGPGNHRRWEVMLLPGDSLSPDFPEDELWPLLRRWLQPGEAKIWRAAAYRFHGLVAESWRKGRILLAGDAAHMTPPFMAQGMVSGLRDVHNLAWKLVRVLRGQASEALLDSYEEERCPHVRQTVLAAMALGRIICERDPERARQRDQELRAAQGGEVRVEYRQNLIPDLEHGLIRASDPLAGKLSPQPRVRAGGNEGLLDDFTGARVRVVLDSAPAPELLTAYRQAVAALDGVLVHLDADATESPNELAVTEVQPLIRPWLQAQGRCMVVVRPDHYVYGSASSLQEGLELLEELKARLT